MVKWTEETKQQLLLAIIEHLNPTSLPWDKLAGAMGPDVSTEAVRQQYKTIKKGFKTPTTSSSSGAASTSPPSAKGKNAKGKKATSASTTTTTNGAPAKGRKRKAAEISMNQDDDDEEDATVKTEQSGTVLTGPVFKAEPIDDENVDLENDALYSAA